MLKYFFLALCVVAVSFTVSSQPGMWTDVAEPQGANRQIQPQESRTVAVDFQQLKSFLLQAPHVSDVQVNSSSFTVDLPTPDGGLQRFKVVESPVMADELQENYPEIRTFVGQGTGSDRHATLRMDFTLRGFHAQVLTPGGSYYIDPFSPDHTEIYIVYTREAFYKQTDKVMPECSPENIDGTDAPGQDGPPVEDDQINNVPSIPELRTTNGTQLRTYRLALACTGEYAQYHGGTVPLVMSAFATTMNRVNGVFERDLSLRMIMVPNNDNLIFLNAGSDPYSNTSGDLNANQSTCDNIIGPANYDIGHLFGTGGGGVAQLFSPCSSNKARGLTGQSNPIGDPFDIDYVAHEMGHQWGANHTQNNSCNRASSAAYEPGSASTIMGYAGICAPNLQSNSDDHFHNHSFNEMYQFSVNGSGNSCAQTTSTGNTPPSVTLPTGGFFIPIETPFELTATATDPNGDLLTYCWEQYDLGPSTSSGDNDLTNPSGNAPIFRSWSPTTDATRVFPRLDELLNNTTVVGEHLPTYSRDLTFRCTVRDNRAGGGGVSDEEVAFGATDIAGPFLVTAPNTPVSWTGNSNETVTWDVANTDASPVNCGTVDIYLSTDGGWTYPTVLASSVANNGSASVPVPNIATSEARIKVKAANNVFFDISNEDFTIVPGVVYDFDVALQSIDYPSGDICLIDPVVLPEITIYNQGTETLTSVEISYTIAGAPTVETDTWTGTLLSGESTTVVLSELAVSAGPQAFNVSLSNPNGQTDQNSSNNSFFEEFTVLLVSAESLPVTNDFEGPFPGSDWNVENPDNDITWVQQSVANDVDCNNGNAATINFYAYNSPGESDDIVTPTIDLTNAIAPEVSFDYAYARYSTSFFDRMQVQIASACSNTWVTLWDKENLDLETGGTVGVSYNPGCGEWSSELIDLAAYAGEVVQIRFRGITGYGNNLFLDNIAVYENAPADCNGDPGGTAFIDDCNECVGGETGLTACLNCDPGFYEDGNTCSPCPPGTFCPGDGNSYPCAAGSSQPQSGQVSCTQCAPGTFSSAQGSVACEDCPTGTYQDLAGSTDCFDCEAGSVSDPGATECTPCSAGTYELNGECVLCPPGTYCPGDGNSYPCAAGTSQPQSGQVSCTQCAPGTFSSTAGSISCDDCPSGTYQDLAGASECFDCEAGTTSEPGSTECTGSSPIIASVAPTTLQCAGGTSLTVIGSNLSQAISVTVGGSSATNLIQISSSEIEVTAPAGSGINVPVQVTTPFGTSNTLNVSYAAPLIASVAPTTLDCAGGATLTVIGSNFCSASSVTVGGNNAPITSVSPTQILATAPEGSGTNVEVQVTTPSGSSNIAQVDYGAPLIASVAPTALDCAGGATLTVLGSNLCSATQVTVNGNNASNLIQISSTEIQVTAPSGSGINVPVQVTTPSGSSNTAQVDYAAPLIASVAPTSLDCAGGTTLAVIGSNFCNATSVTVDGNSGSNLIEVSSTQILVTAPAGSGTNVEVQVTTPSGSSNIAQVDYGAPLIASVAPTALDCAGGATLTITGSNFCSASSVTVGGNVAPITLVSPTQILATAPAGSGMDVDVQVTTPSGISNTAQINYAAPLIASVAPTTLDCAGGATLTVLGSNLCSATQVTVDGNNASNLIQISSTEIQVTAPSGIGLNVPVQVTTASGVSNTVAVDYGAPLIASVAPTTLDCAGGATLTVIGSNFCSASSVTVGGNVAPITLVSPTQILATAPAGSGVSDVLVATPSGTSQPLEVTYTLTGCTDPEACNYDPDAVCDDGSCISEPCDPVCDLEISTSSTPADAGFANGSATVSVSGGLEPYTYQWDDPFMQTTASAEGLFPGSYTCVVTDANDCVVEIAVDVSVSIPFMTALNNSYCNTTGYELSDFIAANWVAQATAYRWEFTPQGENPLPVYTRYAANQWVRLQWINGIELGTTYDVRVKVQVDGIWGEYGSVCTVTTNSNVPTTEVLPNYSPTNVQGELYALCDFAVAYNVANASNFRWRFDPDTDPENGNEIFYTRGTGNPSVRLSWVEGLQPGTTYNVGVEVAVSGNWSGFSAIQEVSLAPVSNNIVLLPDYCDQNYAPNGILQAINTCYTDFYQFRFIPQVSGAIRQKVSGSQVLLMGTISPQLSPGTYDVQVRISQNGVLGQFGESCPITIGEEGFIEQSSAMRLNQDNSSPGFSVYPNPNEGNVIWVEIDGLSGSENKSFSIQLYNAYGLEVVNRNLNVNESEQSFRHQLAFKDKLAPGIYFVKISLSDSQKMVERIVIY